MRIGACGPRTRHAVASIRTYLKRTNFVQAEIERIDLDAKKVIVRLEGGDPYEIPYEQLVKDATGPAS